MDIAIIDKSELSSLRIGSIVSRVKGVNSIIQIIDPKGLMKTLRKTRPDVIIYDLHSNGRDNFRNLQKIRVSFPGALIIALASVSPTLYCSKCAGFGVEYCLDKINEFEKIPKIISGLSKIKC